MCVGFSSAIKMPWRRWRRDDDLQQAAWLRVLQGSSSSFGAVAKGGTAAATASACEHRPPDTKSTTKGHSVEARRSFDEVSGGSSISGISQGATPRGSINSRRSSRSESAGDSTKPTKQKGKQLCGKRPHGETGAGVAFRPYHHGRCRIGQIGDPTINTLFQPKGLGRHGGCKIVFKGQELCESERASHATTDILTEPVSEGASTSRCCA